MWSLPRWVSKNWSFVRSFTWARRRACFFQICLINTWSARYWWWRRWLLWWLSTMRSSYLPPACGVFRWTSPPSLWWVCLEESGAIISLCGRIQGHGPLRNGLLLRLGYIVFDPKNLIQYRRRDWCYSLTPPIIIMNFWAMYHMLIFLVQVLHMYVSFSTREVKNKYAYPLCLLVGSNCMVPVQLWWSLVEGRSSIPRCFGFGTGSCWQWSPLRHCRQGTWAHVGCGILKIYMFRESHLPVSTSK